MERPTVKTALDSARDYLAKLPAAVSGAGGHNATFTAACWCVRFGLSDSDALSLLAEYNYRCRPPWEATALARKLREARKVVGGQVPTFQQPTPAVRLLWKLERKPARMAEPVAIQASPMPATPEWPERTMSEAAAIPAPDCAPWLKVAQQVLAGEFDGCDRSTRESIKIGLCSVSHPTCRLALARLQGHPIDS